MIYFEKENIEFIHIIIDIRKEKTNEVKKEKKPNEAKAEELTYEAKC